MQPVPPTIQLLRAASAGAARRAARALAQEPGPEAEAAHPDAAPATDAEGLERQLQPALDVQCSQRPKGVQVRAKPAEAGAPRAVSGCARAEAAEAIAPAARDAIV